MKVDFSIKDSYGRISVDSENGLNDLRYIPMCDGVKIYNITNGGGDESMAITMSYREFKDLFRFFGIISEEEIVRKMLERLE